MNMDFLLEKNGPIPIHIAKLLWKLTQGSTRWTTSHHSVILEGIWCVWNFLQASKPWSQAFVSYPDWMCNEKVFWNWFRFSGWIVVQIFTQGFRGMKSRLACNISLVGVDFIRDHFCISVSCVETLLTTFNNICVDIHSILYYMIYIYIFAIPGKAMTGNPMQCSKTLQRILDCWKP